MKKFITVLFIGFFSSFIFSTTTYAQWVSKVNAADELKGTDECVIYVYNSQNGTFNYWSDDDEIQIHTMLGIFDYKDEGGLYVSLNRVSVLIGFYSDGKLIEKETDKFYVPDGDSDTAACTNTELGRKIINHIENGGDVRFIAPRYGRADFDLTVIKRK